MKPSWIGIGFSHHSVPSLSKVAMRSATGTRSGPSVVTRETKSMIAWRVGVSFQDSRIASDATPLLPGRAARLTVETGEHLGRVRRAVARERAAERAGRLRIAAE